MKRLETKQECYAALCEANERIAEVWASLTREVPMDLDATERMHFRGEMADLRLAVHTVLKRLGGA